MAPSFTVCSSCLRAARNSVITSKIASPNFLRQAPRTYHIASATSHRPLYLDFLAPSIARNPSLNIPPILPRKPTSYRALATAATSITEPLQHSIPHRARAVLNPRTTEDGSPMSISLSPRASNRLHAISNSDKNSNLALRITVESGGCHGFQYLMSLTDLSKSPATEEDTVFEGDKESKVVIDEASLELLNGSTVDYTMELIGSQFKVTGIPGATSSCGCGTSFDIKI